MSKQDQQESRKIYRKAVAEEFPERITLTLGTTRHVYEKVRWNSTDGRKGLRYGTNPHQRAALYKPQGSKAGIGNLEWIKWGKDGPSATNIEDGSHGHRIVSYFDRPAASVMKHLNPSGVAVQRASEKIVDVYRRARDADPRAAFGSVVVFNGRVDRELAEEIMTSYVEVVYAPDYQEDALSVFTSKKDIRVARVRNVGQSERSFPPDLFVLDDGSIIVEDPYKTKIRSLEDLRRLSVPTRRKPSLKEYTDLLHSWWVACEVRSNAIILWKDGASIAIGTGQQDRVGALENCVEKAHRFGHSMKGSSLASDGFFPKTDNIELAAREGISAIVQPGGSVEDDQVIAACDQHDIAMIIAGERSFRHF